LSVLRLLCWRRRSLAAILLRGPCAPRGSAAAHQPYRRTVLFCGKGGSKNLACFPGLNLFRGTISILSLAVASCDAVCWQRGRPPTGREARHGKSDIRCFARLCISGATSRGSTRGMHFAYAFGCYANPRWRCGSTGLKRGRIKRYLQRQFCCVLSNLFRLRDRRATLFSVRVYRLRRVVLRLQDQAPSLLWISVPSAARCYSRC